MADNNYDLLQVKVLKYFHQIVSDDGMKTEYECNIENCSKKLNGKYVSNLVKHVRRMHSQFYQVNFQPPQVGLNLPQKRLKLIQDWVEIVTVNGRSFLHLADSGFQKVADEKLAELKAVGLGEGLSWPNFSAIKENIAYLAAEVKKKIKEEVKGKYVSLMIDFATKHRRSLMGVSLQFVRDGEIVTRSIGMIRSLASNTGANVLNILTELLNSFGIDKSHIVSVTTDNASNLSLMVKMLNENVVYGATETEAASSNCMQQGSHEHFDINDIDEEIREAIANCQCCDNADSDSDEELDSILNDEEDYETLIEHLKNDYATHTITVNGIKCAAHTLQLAVRDAMMDKQLNIGLVIDLCREVCKSLRKQSYLYLLEENNISVKSPRLDCKTRWSSTYNMVRKHQYSI